MAKRTNITIGPVSFTPTLCIGFTALGFVWASAVNLHHYGKGLFNQPTALSTLIFWVFALVMVWLLDDLGERFQAVLNRLRNRGALAMTENELDGFKRDVEAKSYFAARLGGIFMFLLVVIFYVADFAAKPRLPETHALVQYPFEAGAAFIAGLFMGRTIVHAFVGNLLQRRHFKVQIMPGHPDGAAGLTPIGDLFLRQAVVMLLPAVYFVLGWTVMTVAKDSDSALFDQSIWQKAYAEWAANFLSMFFAMMAVQLLGFFAPMWLFHLEMKEQKSQQLVIADGLSSRITEVKARLAEEDDESQLTLLKDRLSEMVARHQEIESLPSWPVSIAVRRRFAASNLIVSLPVLMGLLLQISEISKLFFQGD
jgi:hypothetical protein